MKDAQKKYSEPKLPVDADLNGFKAGTVGMIWNGIWQTSNVPARPSSFEGGPAPPQIGPQPAIWAGMALLSLPVHKKGEDKCADAGVGHVHQVPPRQLGDVGQGRQRAGAQQGTQRPRHRGDAAAGPVCQGGKRTPSSRRPSRA